DSEDELENIILAAEEESFLSNFKVPWTEASADGGSTSQTNHAKQNESSSNELTIATFSNMFSVLSNQLTSMLEEIIKIDQQTDRIQQQISNMSDRLCRVEQKAGITKKGLSKLADTLI
uniref:t-SNARE coiled-coil homology domain-containing protein n=1 Tax=Anopheles maculatus TaxID=74869 RepID=A0A182SP16_9DIPT